MDGSDFFCDWLTVRQDHPPHEPLYAAMESRFDPETGEVGPRPVPVSVEAACGSTFHVLSDGSRVTWSGNPSRFARWDSVRGLSVDAAKEFVNASLLAFGLPPFSDGRRQRPFQAQVEGLPASGDTGAVVTRLDATTNVSLGSPEDMRAFMVARQRLNPGRLKLSVDQGTIYYGVRSRHRTVRLYDKAADLRDKAVKAASKVSAREGEYVEHLTDVLGRQGVVRVELEAKRALKRYGVSLWRHLSDRSVAPVYGEEFATMTRDVLRTELPEYSLIPVEAWPALAMYRDGVNLREYYSRNVFAKYRKLLAPFGYDISVPYAERPTMFREFQLGIPDLPPEYIGAKPFSEEELETIAAAVLKARRRG